MTVPGSDCATVKSNERTSTGRALVIRVDRLAYVHAVDQGRITNGSITRYLLTVIALLTVTASVPPNPLIVSVTVYVPTAAYTCVGLASVLVNPSPKLHRLLVKLPVEVLVKSTVNGGVPLVGEAVKAAWTGA